MLTKCVTILNFSLSVNIENIFYLYDIMDNLLLNVFHFQLLGMSNICSQMLNTLYTNTILKLFVAELICAANGKGMWRQPNDCQKYVWCVPSIGNFEMTCGAGTVFDPDRIICNWPSAVDPKYGCT